MALLFASVIFLLYLCSRKGVATTSLHGSPTLGCLYRYVEGGIADILKGVY